MAFEHKKQPLASPAVFRRRLLQHFLGGSILIIFSMALGTGGYCIIGKLSVLDGFYNAAMILTGMGPATSPEQTTPAVKVFASLYALYSGIAFLAAVSVVVAPVLHRLLHRLNLDDQE
ncbi:MAG: hypothetical protein GC192_17540 [Bacteroidetes bacterium]|nr:hypothetical protein [Bacteroidota bacterium]